MKCWSDFDQPSPKLPFSKALEPFQFWYLKRDQNRTKKTKSPFFGHFEYVVADFDHLPK